MRLIHVFIDLSVGFRGLSIQICSCVVASERERITAVTSLLRDASSSVTRSIRRELTARDGRSDRC